MENSRRAAEKQHPLDRLTARERLARSLSACGGDDPDLAVNGYWPEQGAALETGTFKEFEAYTALGLLSEVVPTRLPGVAAEGGVGNVGRRDGLGTIIYSATKAIGRLPDCYFQAVGSETGAVAVNEAARRLCVTTDPAVELLYAIRGGMYEVLTASLGNILVADNAAPTHSNLVAWSQ